MTKELLNNSDEIDRKKNCSHTCKICKLKDYISEDWRKYFESESIDEILCSIIKRLHSTQFYPSIEDIFRFTYFFPLEETKVVIIGQDPYHNQGEATGLAFSVSETHKKLPPSLRNILKEVSSNFPNEVNINMRNTLNKYFKSKENKEKINHKINSSVDKPLNGCLIRWLQQNVLLLNSTLTVAPNKPNSHFGYNWHIITDNLINKISENCANVVFMLWGNYAIKKEILIDSKRHLILKSSHPSPFSADISFFGSMQFKKANEYLILNNKKEIDW
ncbi:uracil-DNA glycosylase [Hamiltosporidium magnivora]|uniref:Uracil-DNA glycosylase n=1 Tax=Hamiltosporidium magnivora TaxID=148818 RepID=A0A4Q9LHJ7_9MICR|nr:uracil-DNA glycosylase [Hamiltosporidium magnivora]